MLKFAICDDMVTEAETLKAHVEHYAHDRNIRIDIDTNTETQNILAVLERIAEYDLVFLDIYMESLNGIDLARQLRRQGDKSHIIFFSTSKEHALDAFAVSASQYLVKPVSYEKLAWTIDTVLEQRLKQEASIRLNTGGGVVEIPLNKIVYAETKRNDQHIFLASGEVEKVRMTGGELFELLGGRPEFVRMGASFILNLQYVNTVTSSLITLAQRYKVPVPRGSYAALKQKYLDYYIKPGR